MQQQLLPLLAAAQCYAAAAAAAAAAASCLCMHAQQVGTFCMPRWAPPADPGDKSWFAKSACGCSLSAAQGSMDGSLLPASTLTDQYLADLDDLEDASSGGGSSDDSGSSSGGMSEDNDMEFDEDAAAAEENVGEIRHLIKLCGSDKLKEHLERVAQLQQQAIVVGEALSMKEYDVVVKSSSMMSDLEGELLSLHKYGINP